ncbi:hypothetical protein [Paraprevotella clara]|uniref:hypothetical protein n=1 Tax=Paraprevotella clara TaxID=454154 RepID=UPI00266BBCB8|nr:hypothetical protein [Paraprevotella clara]
MEDGFLRLSRRFFSNEMWKVAREFSECEAWLDLIQSARFDATDKAYSELIGGREISYSRGQYPASISFLMKRWQWSEKRVRYFLSKLKKKGMITTCNKQGMTVITLCNYDEYNPIKGKDKGMVWGIDNDNKINELNNALVELRAELRATSENMSKKIEELGQGKGNKKKKEKEYNPEEDKETSTDVEAKKAEQARKLAAAKAATLSRKDAFYKSLVPYVERYGRDMVRDFFDYWSEMNKSETKMRFEQQTTWEVGKRLATWEKREKINGKPNYSVQPTGTYTCGRTSQDKAASRQSLENLADAILGQH